MWLLCDLTVGWQQLKPLLLVLKYLNLYAFVEGNYSLPVLLNIAINITFQLLIQIHGLIFVSSIGITNLL